MKSLSFLFFSIAIISLQKKTKIFKIDNHLSTGYAVDMNIVNQSEMARRAGVSRQAISNAIRDGALFKTGGGIDIDSEAAQNYISFNRRKQTGRGKRKPQRQTNEEKASMRRRVEARKQGKQVTQSKRADITGYDESVQKLILAKREEELKAAQKKNQVLDREYIKRDVVVDFWKRRNALIKTHLLPQADIIAPDIIAHIDSERAGGKSESEITASLSEQKLRPVLYEYLRTVQVETDNFLTRTREA